MKKMTRMVLIGAVLATSGLTAKIANESYKAVVTNDERIHKAYELAKKPIKAAVLEAIVDATNEEPDERIQKAVVLELEEPKVVHIKAKVRTSAGVSPITSTMDKKPVNKDEEFIGKILHSVNIPDCNIPVQELKYEIKDIFPEFEEVVVVLPNTYDYPDRLIWPEGSFGNTMIPYYKVYYNVTYQGRPLEINYDELIESWGANGLYVEEDASGRIWVGRGEDVTLGEPERKEIIGGTDGVFSYDYDEGDKLWKRRG